MKVKGLGAAAAVRVMVTESGGPDGNHVKVGTARIRLNLKLRDISLQESELHSPGPGDHVTFRLGVSRGAY